MVPCISKDADAIGTTPNKQGVTQNESQETALKNQGINHYYKGEFKPALQCFSKALEIQELDAPNSLTVATSYNNIGSVLKGQGDLEGGLKEYGKALEIQEREALNSLTVATSCNNIRAVLKELDQGDLEGAMKEYYRACVQSSRSRPCIDSTIRKQSYLCMANYHVLEKHFTLRPRTNSTIVWSSSDFAVVRKCLRN